MQTALAAGVKYLNKATVRELNCKILYIVGASRLHRDDNNDDDDPCWFIRVEIRMEYKEGTKGVSEVT